MAALTSKEKQAIGDIVEGTIDSLDLGLDECEETYNMWLSILVKIGRQQDADEWKDSLQEDGYLPVDYQITPLTGENNER